MQTALFLLPEMSVEHIAFGKNMWLHVFSTEALYDFPSLGISKTQIE